MPDGLRTYIEQAEAAETTEDLFRAFDRFTKPYGIDVSCYHITAERLRAVPVETGLIRENFPDDWRETYLARHYEDIDPVIQQARLEAEPFRWFDVEDKVRLTREQRFFLKELRRTGLTDGIAVPIFGPMGTMAYFGLGRLSGTINLPREDLLELQFACQVTHNRYLELASDSISEEPVPALSPRQKEILTQVALGLSNNAIADRLGITENTVDTILRRAFKKLGANNRITAVLKGLGVGLILP
ncbi:MAG: LuxR family transcriptional regulator [Hyphomonas sp.]|nr:LuxR family transcriptional regulator [Hyphomonas sp.]MCB9971428.1 LuxR family transcriptional regulator [Hyphomonas sp.]